MFSRRDVLKAISILPAIAMFPFGAIGSGSRPGLVKFKFPVTQLWQDGEYFDSSSFERDVIAFCGTFFKGENRFVSICVDHQLHLLFWVYFDDIDPETKNAIVVSAPIDAREKFVSRENCLLEIKTRYQRQPRQKVGLFEADLRSIESSVADSMKANIPERR